MTHQFWKGFTKQAGVTEVACVAVVNGDKILMGKRRDNGKWTNPGGHMDPGEKPLDGAVRELFEETGIKADPKDLEHLTSKLIRKPDGKELKIHAFKLDEGHHKTTMGGDPDQEVFRWIWKPLPLPDDVAQNLHVQKENVLLDALGIEYGGKVKIMNGDHYQHILDKMKKVAAAGDQRGFMGALHDHFHHLDMVVPMNVPSPEEEQEQPTKDHQDPPKDDPGASNPQAKLARLNIRKALHHSDVKKLQDQFAQHLGQRDAHHAHSSKDQGGELV